MLPLDRLCLVVFGNPTFRRDTLPVSKDGMPNGDMLNVRKASANLRHGVPKTLRKVRIGLEAFPAVLVIQRLPIVVDNECRDVNFVVVKVLQRVENPLLGEFPSKAVPGAVANTVVPAKSAKKQI